MNDTADRIGLYLELGMYVVFGSAALLICSPIILIGWLANTAAKVVVKIAHPDDPPPATL